MLLAAGGPIASASAATVSANGRIVSVTDGNGATNSLAVSASGTTVTVIDSATPPTAGGAGCSRPSPDRVTCTVAGLGALSIDAGGGNDTVTVAGSVPATIADGAGDDRVTGGDGDDTFAMGTGSDIVNGGGGTDTADTRPAAPR